MKSEGVEVKPLRELTGNAMFNTVFIDDVFVPDDMVLGEVDRGWEVSRNTLTNERVSIGSSEPPFLPSLNGFVEFVGNGHFDQIAQNHAGILIAEGKIDVGRIRRRTPMGRLGEPEEIARCVVFLASDDAGFISGSTISANGAQFFA